MCITWSKLTAFQGLPPCDWRLLQYLCARRRLAYVPLDKMCLRHCTDNTMSFMYPNTVVKVIILSFSLSPCNTHFPGEPQLASFIEAQHDGSGGDNWNYKMCKAPVKSSPPTNQYPMFYRPDALPVVQPTVSKHWRENITFQGLTHPKLTWQSCLGTVLCGLQVVRIDPLHFLAGCRTKRLNQV